MNIIDVPGMRALAHSAVQVTAPADTNENAMATVAIPAGAMGPNGYIDIISHYQLTSDASNKTFRWRLGGIAGTIFVSFILTTSASVRTHIRIANRGATNSQISSPATGTSFGATGASGNTGAVDTSTAQDLVLTAQKADGTDTITLEDYSVVVVYGA